MATSSRVVLFDVHSTVPGNRKSWSPHCLKTRGVLNYKQLPYISCYISYPNIEPLLDSLGLPPPPKPRPFYYTCPAIYHPESLASVVPGGKVMRDSLPIAEHLEKTFPERPIFPPVDGDGGKAAHDLAVSVQATLMEVTADARLMVLSKIPAILDPQAQEFFIRTRTEQNGKPLAEIGVANEAESWERITALLGGLAEKLASEPGPFFLGETLSYADLLVAAFLGWYERGSKPMFDRMVAVKNGELQRLWDACLPYTSGQGEVREWVVGKDGVDEVWKPTL